MEPRDFCYWLQGFMEIQDIGSENDMEGIHPEQARIIRDHLKLVFDKQTPNRSGGSGGGSIYPPSSTVISCSSPFTTDPVFICHSQESEDDKAYRAWQDMVKEQLRPKTFTLVPGGEVKLC